MKVVMDGPPVIGDLTGPGVHQRELLRHLLDLDDVDVSLRLPGRRATSGEAHQVGSVHPRLTARRVFALDSWLVRSRVARTLLPERILSGAYDVFHMMHTGRDPGVPSGRLVVTVHDTVLLRWPEEGRAFPGAARVLRRCAAVLTVSEYSKGEIVSAYGTSPDRVHVIPNGLDADRFNPESATGATGEAQRLLGFDGPYVLYVGGFTPRKNVRRLLEAFGALAAHQDTPSDLRLVLAGTVVHGRTELSRALPPGYPMDRLTWLGHVPDDMLAPLYGRATLLAMPTLYEGFGMPAIEAQACGTPVLTSSTTACPEIAGPAAVLVDPTDVEGITDGMARLLRESPNMRTERVALGRQNARRFDWSVSAQAVADVYRRIADSSPAG